MNPDTFLVLFLLFLFIILCHHCNCTTQSNILTSGEIDEDETAIWGPALEEWVLSNHREKRVLHIPIRESDAFPVKRQDENDVDNRDDKQSKISPGKIISNPPPQPPKRPSGSPVSETDLYLLGAIEKLVYKVDFMEKRLRRVEEMLYYVMAGNRIDNEPCANNFTRVGSGCYWFSSQAGREYDWKAASKQCRHFGAALSEMETIEENQDIVAYIQSMPNLRGKDYWTGGLNPGLLWIWSNSARPVADGTTDKDKNKKQPQSNILGTGRCLRLAYNPALRSYAYRGSDCGARYSYICEIQENTSSNELRRLGKSRKILSDEL